MNKKLTAAVANMMKVRDACSRWGSGDSEPRNFYLDLMERALDGTPWSEPVDPERWELFSSVPGWRKAANRMTAAAKRVYTAIQASSIAEAQELRRSVIGYGGQLWT